MMQVIGPLRPADCTCQPCAACAKAETNIRIQQQARLDSVRQEFQVRPPQRSVESGVRPIYAV